MKYLSVVMGVLCLTACAGSAYRLPDVNEADIQSMNKKIAASRGTIKTYDRTDKANRQLVENAAKRLIKNAKPLCKYTGYQSCYFEVIYKPDSTFNAFAGENNKITIYRGLVQHLKNSDEVAAVIAHEMGHHLANHNQEKTQNAATGAAISGILTAVLLGAAGANNPYYTQYQAAQNQKTVEDMMNAGASIGALSYSKEQEREADLLGIYLLSRAGYNLRRAQNVMLVLADEAGEKDTSRAAFMDSHPAGIERFVAWEKAIDEVSKNPSKLPYIKEQPTNKTAKKPQQKKNLGKDKNKS